MVEFNNSCISSTGKNPSTFHVLIDTNQGGLLWHGERKQSGLTGQLKGFIIIKFFNILENMKHDSCHFKIVIIINLPIGCFT